MRSEPLVTVVLPAFNGAAFIAEAIASVRRQSHPALEIVVVDDGSTDATATVVQSLGDDIRYVRQRRGGPAAARNRGVSLARGSLVAFIDQDDLWPDDHLSVLQTLLAETAAVAMGTTQALVPASEARATVFVPYGAPWRAPHVGAALFRREAFEIVGSLDQTLRYCSDDLDWFMRARERGAVVAETDAVTLLFRIHHMNTSRDTEFRRNALLEAVHASIRRRQRFAQDQ